MTMEKVLVCWFRNPPSGFFAYSCCDVGYSTTSLVTAARKPARLHLEKAHLWTV